MSITITPEVFPSSTFFDTVRVPGVGQPADTYVDVPSRYLWQMGEYYIDQSAPNSVINIMVTANSRQAAVNDAGDRLWARSLSNGYARWLYPRLNGVSFSGFEILARRGFGIDVPATPWTFGSNVGNARTDSKYYDLAHFGFQGYSDARGPGGGVAMDTGANAFTQYQRNMVEASLPSGINGLFGSGGPYEGRHPLEGDSLLINSEEAECNIVYMKGPGFGTWRWEHVTADASSEQGSFAPEDPVNIEIDSDTGSVLDHTMTASDSYTSGTKTFAFDSTPVAFADVEVDHAVMADDGLNFVCIGVIVSKTADSFTVRWDFETAPTTGDVLHFGPYSIAKETYTMPTTADEYRGVRMTNTTGLNFMLGMSVIRTNVTGFSIGGAGWSGNGYGNQLDAWPRESWFGELCDILNIKVLIAHLANQGSTAADMETFMTTTLAESSTTEGYYAGDSQHAQYSSGQTLYDNVVLAQTATAGGIILESQFSGDHWASWEMGHRGNTPHPNMIGHSESIRPHLWMMSYLSKRTVFIADARNLDANVIPKDTPAPSFTVNLCECDTRLIDPNIEATIRKRNAEKPVSIVFEDVDEDYEIRYTVNGKNPTSKSLLYDGEIILNRNLTGSDNTIIKARIFHKNNPNIHSRISKMDINAI